MQYVILTASGWNGYCCPNSKYWRELFLPPPPLQTRRSCRLPDCGHLTGKSTTDDGRQGALHCKLMSWFIRVLICLWSEILDGCRGFLVQVESVISDPVCLLASMSGTCCVFCQLATQDVEIQLGKQAVGRVTQTKTKTDILTQNAHFKVE